MGSPFSRTLHARANDLDLSLVSRQAPMVILLPVDDFEVCRQVVDIVMPAFLYY